MSGFRLLFFPFSGFSVIETCMNGHQMLPRLFFFLLSFFDRDSSMFRGNPGDFRSPFTSVTYFLPSLSTLLLTFLAVQVANLLPVPCPP